MSAINFARVQKALRHRLAKAKKNLLRSAVQTTKFESPTALREFSLRTQARNTSFSYEIRLPQNFNLTRNSLDLGQITNLSIRHDRGILQVSASFSNAINEGFFANAVARMISPALDSQKSVSRDFQTRDIRGISNHRIIFGEITQTDAAEMEAANTAPFQPEATDFDVALFNPIGLRLKKLAASPTVAKIEIGKDFKLAGQSQRVDEHLVAKLRGFAAAEVVLTNEANLAWLTGLAATGLVLHCESPISELVDSQLRELLHTPLPASDGSASSQLQWLLRSEKQRRLAFQKHSGWFESDADLPIVDILLVTNRIAMVPAALEFISRQSYPNFKVKIGLHNIAAAAAAPVLAGISTDNVSVEFFRAEQNLGEIYGTLTAQSTADFIAKFDDDDMYGPNHLWDAIISMRYSGAGLFGRTPNLTWLATTEELLLRPFGDEEIFHKYIIGPTMVINRLALKKVGGWRPTPWAVDKALIDRFQTLGGGIYRAGAFGWIYVRHDQGHTWLRDESHFRNQAEHIWTAETAQQIMKEVLDN